MSRWPCRITSHLPVVFQWATWRPAAKQPRCCPARCSTSCRGSLLEQQIGTANFTRLTGQTDAAAWADHSCLAN